MKETSHKQACGVSVFPWVPTMETLEIVNALGSHPFSLGTTAGRQPITFG